MTAVATATADIATLPQWARELDFPVDQARDTIRKTPDLRALGRVIGATRLYTLAEAERIRAAVIERQQSLKEGRGGRKPVAAGEK